MLGIRLLPGLRNKLKKRFFFLFEGDFARSEGREWKGFGQVHLLPPTALENEKVFSKKKYKIFYEIAVGFRQPVVPGGIVHVFLAQQM